MPSDRQGSEGNGGTIHRQQSNWVEEVTSPSGEASDLIEVKRAKMRKYSYSVCVIPFSTLVCLETTTVSTATNEPCSVLRTSQVCSTKSTTPCPHFQCSAVGGRARARSLFRLWLVLT